MVITVAVDIGQFHSERNNYFTGRKLSMRRWRWRFSSVVRVCACTCVINCRKVLCARVVERIDMRKNKNKNKKRNENKNNKFFSQAFGFCGNIICQLYAHRQAFKRFKSVSTPHNIKFWNTSSNRTKLVRYAAMKSTSNHIKWPMDWDRRNNTFYHKYFLLRV